MDKDPRGLVRGLSTLYIITVLLAAPYYNWRYAQERGFSSWFFFGEVVATGKALIWPYYVFVQQHVDESAVQARRMGELILLTQEASQFSNALDLDTVTEEGAKKVSDYRKKVIEKSVSVNFEVIDSIYPALGTMFKSTVLAALMAIENEGLDAIPKAKSLWEKWVGWFNARRPEIVEALRAAAGD